MINTFPHARTRFRKRQATAMILAGAVAFTVITAVPANAAEPGGCSDADLQSGVCITYAAVAGEDPATAGIQYLAQQGKVDQANRYISTLKSKGQASKAAVLQSALEVARSKKTSNVSQSTAAPTPQAVSPMGTKYHDGFLQPGNPPFEWDLANTLEYGVCNTSCTPEGHTLFELWLSLADYGTPGYGVSLAGTIEKKDGPLIRLSKYTCKTFYEVAPFDQNIHDWSNCSAAPDPNYFGVRQVNYQGWDQGSAPGTQYHLEVTTEFYAQGDSFLHGHVWNSYSYRVYSTNNASFLTS